MGETRRWQSIKPLPWGQSWSSFVNAEAYTQSLQPFIGLFLKIIKKSKKLEIRKKD